MECGPSAEVATVRLGNGLQNCVFTETKISVVAKIIAAGTNLNKVENVKNAATFKKTFEITCEDRLPSERADAV